jgi:tetratricopeptide (TPR) repeat protein
MQFDPNNEVIQLCAKGIETEGTGDIDAAKALYLEAWGKATNNMEWFTAAHYLARNQTDLNEQLKWNMLSLEYALKIDDEAIKGTYPSLYLNMGKSYEDLGNIPEAAKYYTLAQDHTHYLPDDGYGKMIRGGITEALKRVNDHS